MKTYGKKLLSVTLAVLMCLTVGMLNWSGLLPEANAYETSPSHTYRFIVRQGWSLGSHYDGRDGNTTVTIWGKDKDGNGSSEEQIYSSSSVSGCWAYASGSSGRGDAYTGEFTSNKFPTKAKVGISICRNGAVYESQSITSKLTMQVKNAATGAWIDVDCFQFTFKSDVNSDGSGSTWKETTQSFTAGKPYAAKVATSAGGDKDAIDTVNITLNATGGSNKTQGFNAYVYDQYNVIWTAAPKKWSKSGTTACTTTLSTTGASESNTLTMSATNSTYQKATCTVKAEYDSLYHQWNVVITPTYKITFNVSTNGGTSTAPGSDTVANTNTGSSSVNYTLQSSQTASKTNSTTGTWTFVGWNGTSSANTGTKPTNAIAIDSYNDTLYAIFSKSATATFYWYKSDGSRTSSTNTKTIYNNATQFTFDVPKSSVPTTVTANGTTYTFAGWAVDSTTKTTADHAASVTTATRNANTGTTYSFYALYTGSVTLSYNNNGGSGSPASKTANLTLNCGANTSAASNTSGRATFTINPDNVAMSRSYSSAFIGWNTTQKDDETAQYKDATVTWSASSSLPTEITIAKSTTLYAAYYDFRYNVKFHDYSGAVINTQTIRHNYSATAPTMKTNAADPSHTDSGSHYVFDHWEYTDGNTYTDENKLTNGTNGYTYDVWGKYVGHKHIWGERYGLSGATTCSSGMTYWMKCTVCGYERQFTEEPLGHVYQIVGVAEPTCTKAGSYGKKVCVNCGELDPTYSVEIDGVDTLITDENRIRPALGHLYGIEDLEKDDDGFYILTDTEGNYFVAPIEVEATCTTAGYRYYKCSRCGDKYRVENLPATGHKWKTVDEIPASCTEGGHTGYTYCEKCNLFLDGVNEDTEALGHAYELVAETNSTCTVKGHYAYYECSRCGAYFDKVGEEEYVAIEDITTKDKALLDHDYQASAETIEPTCTEEGHIGAKVCTMCGAVDPDHQGETTPALGHVWERDDFAGYATYADVYGEEYVDEYVSGQPCVDPCSVTYTCPDCSETITFTDDPADHVIAHEGRNEPTCTEEGNIEYWYCEVCGTYFSDADGTNVISAEDVVIPMAPHELETIPGEAPTCTEDGIPDCYECTVCGKLFLDEEGRNEITGDVGIIPKLGHNWTSWVVAVQPTDTEPGLEKRKCIRCGEVEERDIEATGHNMTFVAAKAATCTEPGNVAYYACDRCGRNFADEEGNTEIANVVIAALGHALPDTPTEAVPATCAAEGYNKYVCSRCNLTVIETLPKLSEHGEAITYGENRPATCAAPGQVAGTMCSVCGAVLTQPTSIAKLAHTPEAERRDVKAATCIETGYTGDLYCDVCGQKLETGTTVEKTSHQYGDWVTVEATCTEYGSRTRTCAICGDKVVVELPVLGHQVVADKAVAATCAAGGLTAGKHCSRCGLALELQEVVPATGHNYTETVVAPTCTTLGYTVHTCGGCGDTYKDNYTAKVAHVQGTPATCTEAAVCANCGRSFGEALGHDYQLDEAACTPSTCIARGAWVYKCTRCGDTYSEAKELGRHTWDEASVVEIPATCTQAGSVSVTCSVCGTVSSEDYAPLGHDYQNGTCTRCGAADPNYNPGASAASEKCEKCGLNHNGRTGLWKQDGFFCKIIGFFRSLFKGFGR